MACHLCYRFRPHSNQKATHTMRGWPRNVCRVVAPPTWGKRTLFYLLAVSRLETKVRTESWSTRPIQPSQLGRSRVHCPGANRFGDGVLHLLKRLLELQPLDEGQLSSQNLFGPLHKL